MIFQTYSEFSPSAKKLRKHFENRFSSPEISTHDRFVWDYWHVPQQYNFIRTPAFEYFPKKLYRDFHTHLVRWGRTNLGCHDISPTWLSFYVEGCFQAPHVDEPHGPLAFVLSLTNWQKRKFSGGETILHTRPKEKIPPRFNQLLLFDPSVRHSVARISNVLDPALGRLVLHGWFVQPRVFWQGPMQVKDVERVLNESLMGLAHEFKTARGFASFRLQIDKAGLVKRSRCLVETMNKKIFIHKIESKLKRLRFKPMSSSAQISIPLVFR